jgi:pimeloyl-ACP methyl ester carboxylesterase
MPTTTSADGTEIAYETFGQGPPLVTVVGAFCERAAAQPLAHALADDFTVYCYDRRGRGDSGNTLPYAPERELEDIAALLTVAGEGAALYGHSSGAVLALLAAADGLPVAKVVAYEPPWSVEAAAERTDLAARVDAAIADGRPGDAAEMFMREGPGMPEEVIAGMKAGPGWAYFEKLGPTVAHDLAIVGDEGVPSARLAQITVPTLVIAGGASDAWARETVAAVADAIPASERMTVDGQDHNVDQQLLASLIRPFLQG